MLQRIDQLSWPGKTDPPFSAAAVTYISQVRLANGFPKSRLIRPSLIRRGYLGRIECKDLSTTSQHEEKQESVWVGVLICPTWKLKNK